MSSNSFLASLLDAGEIGKLIAKFDWGNTSLGPIETWNAATRAVVGTMLRTPTAQVSLWGKEGVMIYNDAYARFADARHPSLLGSEVRKGWPEVAAFNDNVMRTVLSGGTLRYVNQELILYRSGAAEQVWLNLDYGPIVDGDSVPVGVMAIVTDNTAAITAERKVATHHTRLAAMFDQAPGFVAMLEGPEHRFTLVNKAYSELVGHRDVMGKILRIALPEAVEQGFADLLDQIYTTGEPYFGYATPFAIMPADGSQSRQSFVDFVYQPLRNEYDEIFGIFVQGSDVTARVLAERAVRQSETAFDVLAHVMPGHIWLSDNRGFLTWFNDRTYQYAGTAHGALDGAMWHSLLHPDDLERVGRAWEQSVATGSDYAIEFRIRRFDGLYRWFLVKAAPVLDENGEVMRWIGTNTDIHDQIETSDALANANALLEVSMQQAQTERDQMWRLSTDVMIVTDVAGSIVDANPAFVDKLGFRDHDYRGRSIVDFVQVDDREDVLQYFGRPQTTQFSMEARLVSLDGNCRLFAWAGVQDSHQIYVVGRDITYEREAAYANRQTELALQHSQRMETMGKLTGGVAHDFNNLLQVMYGNLQLLSREVIGNSRAEDRVQKSLEAVARGARLAAYLLAYGRRQALEPRVLKPSRVVNGMEEMLFRTLGDQIELEVVSAASLWNTLIDASQLENAILNLCINARDAMPYGGKLTIELANASLDAGYVTREPDLDAGQYVMLAVSDTGVGMDNDVLKHAFDPFFSTKEEGKGSGLGLSMVYGFAKQSGGHVKIYSEPGQGTTVKMYLPRSYESAEPVAAVETTGPIGGRETILVVEDDEDVRQTTVEILAELGYTVLKAPEASSALIIVGSGIKIDLLFTDVMMPGPLRSTELVRRAKEIMPELAVLYASGYAENAIVHGGRLDPGVELLSKPYTRDTLARRIRQVLSTTQRESGTAGTMKVPPLPQPCTILFVEDDDAIRDTTVEMLRYLKQEVHAASTGAEALEMIERHRFDVLLSDVGLPDVSGETVAKEFRRKFPNAPIIYVSGRMVEHQSPNSYVLLKPYSLHRFLEVFHECTGIALM